MFKSLVTILILVFSFSPVFSINNEDSDKNSYSRNTVFFELGGLGIFASLNYEPYIFRSLGIRLGFGLSPLGYSYPLALNYYFGKEKRLELGIGLIHLRSSWKTEENNLFFKDLNSENITDNFISATIGYSFKKNPAG